MHQIIDAASRFFLYMLSSGVWQAPILNRIDSRLRLIAGVSTRVCLCTSVCMCVRTQLERCISNLGPINIFWVGRISASWQVNMICVHLCVFYDYCFGAEMISDNNQWSKLLYTIHRNPPKHPTEFCRRWILGGYLHTLEAHLLLLWELCGVRVCVSGSFLKKPGAHACAPRV